MGVGTPPPTSDLASDVRIGGVARRCFNVTRLLRTYYKHPLIRIGTPQLADLLQAPHVPIASLPLATCTSGRAQAG